MQEIPLNIRYSEKGLSKFHKKKFTLFFLSNPFPFNGQRYQTQKGPGTSDQWLFRIQNKFTKTSLLVIYYLSKFDAQFKAVFELFQKLHLQIYASQFLTS